MQLQKTLHAVTKDVIYFQPEDNMKHETRGAKSEKVFKNYTRVENYFFF